MESRFKTIKDNNKKQKALNQYILQSAKNDDSRPMISQAGIRDCAYIEELQSEDNLYDDDDVNADVPETGGSDTFKSLANDGNNNFDNANVTDQLGIRDLDDIDEGVMHFREVESRPPSPTLLLLLEEEKDDGEVKSTDVELPETPTEQSQPTK